MIEKNPLLTATNEHELQKLIDDISKVWFFLWNLINLSIFSGFEQGQQHQCYGRCRSTARKSCCRRSKHIQAFCFINHSYLLDSNERRETVDQERLYRMSGLSLFDNGKFSMRILNGQDISFNDEINIRLLEKNFRTVAILKHHFKIEEFWSNFLCLS